MRKVRDYDAELKALGEKARGLKARRIQQLGELVTATGADALDPETLAGLLLSGIAHTKPEAKEAWRAKGTAFFQGHRRKTGDVPADNRSGPAPDAASDTTG